VSQIASTSRWKCTQPFGSPVVPEVKAISATSSLRVATGSKEPMCPRQPKARLEWPLQSLRLRLPQ